MKFVRRYVYPILLSALLAAGAVFVCIMAERLNPRPPEPTEVDPAFLVIGSEGAAERIAIYDAGDGNRYVFLPSYAQLDRVTVAAGKGHDFTLGGVALVDGLRCDIFRLDTPYVFASDGQNLGNLRFCRSENVAAIYIDTKSGDMKGIHRDTFPEERISTRVYTADGRLELLNEYALLKCRGFSSWGLDKKSYTLDLGQSTELLNMGTSRKWTLTANGFDQTRMRNKIAYSLANGISPHPGWAPECEFAELYLNGEYVGLYLLCQKPDTGPDHLNLALEDYYFETVPITRLVKGPRVFDYRNSLSIEVRFPKECEPEQMEYLQSRLEVFYDALLLEEGTHETDIPSWQDCIDIDSWARKYLIEEIFSNTDGGRGSQYYRFDGMEEKIYIGHCWDYDASLGRTGKGVWPTPCSTLAQRDWKGGPSWFGLLCQKEEFMDTVTQIYEKEFRPLLLEYANSVISEYAQQIRQAMVHDFLRWPERKTEAGWDADVQVIRTFLKERVAFLDALWLEKEEFYIIEGNDSNLYVPAGTVCENFPQPPGDRTTWYLAGTDIPIDVTQPITGNLMISHKPASEIVPEETQPPVEKPAPGPATQDYVTAVSVAALVLLLLCFGAMDFFQRRKDRRKANDHSRTKISP